jgi:16S rRNA (cytosine967-C5)-methyltransferase
VTTPARRLAASVLARVAAGQRTLADTLADEEIEGLDPRERAFLHELVLGTLRRRGWIDHVLGRLASRPLGRTSPGVREALRLGAYQLLYLRVPAHAAVSESVALARAAEPQGRAAGFVNAVLRRLQREGPPPEPNAQEDPHGWLTTAGSLPGWLATRWLERLGAEEAVTRARALLEPPSVGLRLHPRVVGSRARALSAELDLHETEVPGAWEAADGRLTDLARQGLVYVQDVGSQLVAHLAVRAGTILDACAAPGGKALLMADHLAATGRVVATEASPRRLRTLAEACTRWGARNVHPIGGDALEPPFRRPFDSILLDAPCSGLGTLARHPDIRWRLRPGDVDRHADRQRAMLDALAGLVRPGGRLVYSTCSVEDEETEDVVRPFLESHPGFEVEELPGWASPFTVGPFVKMDPARRRGDAFFAARLTRAH